MILLTNFIMLFIVISSSLNFLPNTCTIKYYTICKSDFLSISPNTDWIKYILSRLVFLDLKNFFLALLILSIFRNFERIYGNKKFINYMFTNFILSTVFELCIINLLRYFNIVNLIYLANGCFSIIFSLFINYCKDIPREKIDFFGINIPEKILIYFLGIQMLFSTTSIFVACLSGILSGLFSRSNAFYVCDFIKIPNLFSEFILKFLNKFPIKFSSTESFFNTATHQDRRQQYLEYYEQNLINNSTNTLASNNFTNLGSDNNYESNVVLLQEMGFNRIQAENALSRANNDLNRATLILLEYI